MFRVRNWGNREVTRQVAVLLHTAFRRHLAMTPLCFANPSPPSGWTGDFHPQAIEHAGHTTTRRSPPQLTRFALDSLLEGDGFEPSVPEKGAS